MAIEHVDVLVVGAGISGICVGYYLQTHLPGKSYTILEGRDTIGGTWDLFRYPGIRSDSDMYTLGYSFRPWTDVKGIADGDTILQYLKDTASAHQIDKKIRFGCRATQASWSTQDAQWTVQVQRQPPDKMAPAETVTLTCQFLFMCSGYYSYEAGYTPDFPGIEDYKGEFVHPQQWTDDIEYKDKRVVVIGSGATAVTLVPALAQRANHVTMLQRSPTYVVSRPAIDPVASWLHKRLPRKLAYRLTRWKNIMLQMYFYRVSKRRPAQVRKFMLDQVKKVMGPDFDVDKHFGPTYDPWDQRVCLIPDEDLFNAIKEKRASVVTDQIERFTENGILLASGQTLEADLIVTATGLQLQFLGGMQLVVDGEAIAPSDTMTYKGVMFSDIPNMALASGYTNASWTLKCELSSGYICRLLQYMDAHGFRQCTPRLDDESVSEAPFLALQSGYIDRSRHLFPKQGSKAPWKLYQNYILDTIGLKHKKVEGPGMEFR